MTAVTVDQDTTNAERVFGERYAVAPDFLLKAAVSCNAKMLWLAYQRHADPEGRCFPSAKRVAALYLNGVSVETVKRAKRELIEAGLISVDERYDESDNGRRTSDYVTLLRPPRERTFGYGQKRYPPLGIKNDRTVSSNHLEVSNPPKPPLSDDGEHASRRRAGRAPRVRGDDRSGEHVAPVTRAESDAPLERQKPDPPRVPLYAEQHELIPSNVREPLTEEFVKRGLAEIKRLREAQYHPTVTDPKAARS